MYKNNSVFCALEFEHLPVGEVSQAFVFSVFKWFSEQTKFLKGGILPRLLLNPEITKKMILGILVEGHAKPRRYY